jgi:hypothetical protein
MFEDIADADLVGAIDDAASIENKACARRLAAPPNCTAADISPTKTDQTARGGASTDGKRSPPKSPPPKTCETPTSVVVHVVGQATALDTTTTTGPSPPARTAPRRPAPNPALVLGGPLIPAEVVAKQAARGAATIRPLLHPGDRPPGPRYRPSAAPAEFVRCRDQTCRFVGCDHLQGLLRAYARELEAVRHVGPQLVPAGPLRDRA